MTNKFRYPKQPRFIQIETIIGCDAQCPFCPQRLIDRQPPRMPDRTWKKIIDDTRGLGITYRPFLQNEALIDRRLPEIVSYIKQDPTAHAELNTNGNALTEDTARALIEAGIDLVRFSVDAFSEETYKLDRVGLDYHRVVENIERFVDMVADSNHHAVTEMRMIDMESNRHEQQDYLQYWSKRVDRALIVPMYNWPWSEGVEMVPKPCLKMREEMFFYSDGRAVLCCWDIAGRAVLGNVNASSVLDIWNGEIKQRYNDILSRGERDKILLCSKCDAYRDRHFEGFDN
ncbi:MAG: radical SAM protein [Candidatus Krumholzibacteriota bacterium]|nr:radical SAM protein [Candidatus Krumholzibacteriota bacterium]